MNFTPGYLFASMIVSTIGFGLFLYGKKQERIPQFAAGLALAVFPIFVSGVALMIGIAVAILAGLTLIVRAGY